MISVLLGIATALQWGLGALVLRPAARDAPPKTFAFWFAFYNTALMIIPGTLLIARDGLSLRAAAIGAVAAIAELIGITTYARALERGDMVTVAPLVSLEGAFAAVIGITAGDAIGGMIGVALALCVVGGLFLGLPGGIHLSAPGSGYAIGAAAGFGAMLWLVGGTGTNTVVLLLVLNAFDAVILAAAFRSKLSPAHTSKRTHLLLAAAAALNLGGLLAYSYGAVHGSLPVTAVLAAQFAVPAIIGGYVMHHERLTLTQGAGAVALICGVSLLAISGG